jgi:hypothetical protein
MDFEESGISRIDGAPVIDETHPVSTVEQEM